LGLTSEHYQIGKNPVNLSELIMGVVLSLTRFYMTTMRDVSTEEINAEIQRAAEGVRSVSFVEVRTGHGGQANQNHGERRQ